uniref:trypsin n=1 Tax=Pygocentrus nattereri TaxID=42514 RepID=A0A3B4CSH4_PYGNA
MRTTFVLLLVLILQLCAHAESPEEDSRPSGPVGKPKESKPTGKPGPDPQPSKLVPDQQPSKPDPDPQPSKPGPDPQPSKPGPDPQPSKPGPDPQPSKPGPDPQPSKPGPDPQPSKPGRPTQPSKPGPDPQPSKPDPDPQPSKPGPDPQPSKPGPDPQPSKPGPDPQPSKPGPDPQPSKPDPDQQPSKPGRPPQPSKPGPDPQPTKPGPDQQPPKPGPDLQPRKPPSERLSQECLKEKYTRLSCSKVFCPPWRRCINGKCVCKLPYQCPRLGRSVCGLNGQSYISYCQAQAIACRTNTAVFSHYGSCDQDAFKAELKKSGDRDVVQVETIKGRALICGAKSWDMAAANVLCRSLKAEARGAASAQKMMFKDLEFGHRWPYKCVSVSCTGSEYSLAECTINEPQDVEEDTQIAAFTCYKSPQDDDECPEFRCVNEKCILWKHTCDGVDDCGDNSDEMCCSECQSGAFHCKSGVCIPGNAVRDRIRDCLGGEDEVTTAAVGPAQTELVWRSQRKDILQARNYTESQLECGIPNFSYVYRKEEETRPIRRKRMVGGQEALPWQFQWQVAVQEKGKFRCGGVYLGGCWVLTAAHCVSPKPASFRIWFSLWKRHPLLSTTDVAAVKNIIIHHAYNPRTYQNDIALVQLEELRQSNECLQPNPAVRPVCLPWSTLQFQDGDTCTISGWGGNKEGVSTGALKWANVTITGNCKTYYEERFLDGMECAGDVDSCQGNSGGPLVCEDASGLSYVWGIVSWGQKCGEAGSPGVYTKVAHYFEWIRFYTGWPAVTKYNR